MPLPHSHLPCNSRSSTASTNHHITSKLRLVIQLLSLSVVWKRMKDRLTIRNEPLSKEGANEVCDVETWMGGFLWQRK
ncbi:hypothetical protein J6590_010751 [Homalodisca vitripennis]|nr:hypothetical protein J6590_010751 [Homalodisca vitripennis]